MITARELSEKRAKIVSDARKIMEKAQTENRSMSNEENEQFDKLHTEADTVKATFEKIALQERAEVALNEVQNERRIGREDKPFETGTQKASVDENRRHEAWQKYCRLGMGRMAYEEQRALGEASGSIGGYTVPVGFENQMVKIEKAYGGVLSAPVTLWETEQGNDIDIPIGDDTYNVGSRIGENTAMSSSGSDPVFTQGVSHCYTYSSNIVLVPLTLLQDNGVNLDAYLAERLAIRIVRAVNPDLTSGTGSSQPQGILNGVSGNVQDVSTNTATISSFTKLVDLVHTVDPAYRFERAKVGFMCHDSTLKVLKKMVDGQSRPLWMPGITSSFANDFPDTILGYPIYINMDMDAPAASKKTILFGNFKYYYARRVLGGGFLRMTERYADSLQVGFAFWQRFAGVQTNQAAFATYQQSAS